MKTKIFDRISKFFTKPTIYHRCKKEIYSLKKGSATEEFERCVLCGKLTCIPISMPVDWRENYEIGCGQLCVECAKKQQKVAERDNILSPTQILLAVEQSRKNSK